MPTAEEITAADTAAAAKAASDAAAATEKAAADQASAEKAAADQAAADAAKAGKTPEPLAAEKATADAETARTAAEQAKAPEKYALTLPKDAPFGEDFLETAAAEAKAGQLTNDQAQALVTHRAAEQLAFKKGLRTQLEADKELGGAHLAATEQYARAGLEAIFPKGSKGGALIRDFLERSGLGDHPDLVREFVRLGKATGEDRTVKGHNAAAETDTSTLEDRAKKAFYGGPASDKE